MILNVNSFVNVKLTPRGRELYLFYFGKDPELDSNGLYRCRMYGLFQLFHLFGDGCDYSKEVIFEPEITYEG